MNESNTQYDIAVIGGGPAGATFARLVDSEKYNVIVINKPDSKPCGGLLAPDAQKLLASLDMTLPKDVLVDPQIFSVKTMDLEQSLIRYYPRFYMNMDRREFDAWLLSLVPGTVTIMNGKCTKIERDKNSYKVTVLNSAEKITFSCSAIVGADGANSLVRRTFFDKIKMKSYTAVQQWYKATDISPFYSCIFDNATSPACSWSIVKDSYFIFGGAFKPEKCRENFERQKQKLEKYGFKFSECVKTEACRVLRPTLFGKFCTGRNNIFLIGEAAGFISPSSFEGISYAIKSALTLSDAVNSRGLNAASYYARKTMPIRLKLKLKCLKRIFMYTPVLRRLVMLSRIQSINIAQENIKNDKLERAY